MPRRLPLALVLVAGCFADPGAVSGGPSSASGESDTTSTSSSGAATTSVTMTTGADSSGGAGSSGGEATGSSGDPATSEPATSAPATSDASTTTGDPPQPLLLSNHEGATCEQGPHCYGNGGIAPATIHAYECFSSPIAPPFAVTRVDAEILALVGMPTPALTIYAFDAMTKEPGAELGGALFPPLTDELFLSLTPPEPLVVDVADFCVELRGGDDTSTLAPAATPAGSQGPAFVAISGAGSCALSLTPLATILGSPNARYCISVEITPL